MKRGIFLSTFSAEAIRIIREYGIGIEYNQFCISSTLDESRIGRTLAAMEKAAVNSGCDLSGADGHPAGSVVDPGRAIVHGPFTEIIPGAIDTAALDYMMRRVEQAAEGTARLGLNRLVLHTGYYPAVYFPQWHVRQSVKFWRRFMENRPADFRLYIENVFDPEPEPLMEILDEVDDPRVMACLDVGHAAAVGSDPLDWIRRLGSRIGHFHLHNNDGKADSHAPLTEGVIDMKQVLRAIDSYCPAEATLTIESRQAETSVVWLLAQ